MKSDSIHDNNAMKYISLLEEYYGHVIWKPRLDPISELIFTILTQHTSDKNAEKAYMLLVKSIDSWNDILDIPIDKLKSLIKSAGLFNQKSKRIIEAINRIKSHNNELNLSFLRDLNLSDARKWLTGIPGIGPKTASVVLSFSFGMPAIPVDTHVYRVSKRLKLFDNKISANHAHELLENLVIENKRYTFHVLFIKHGREICKAIKPLCKTCPLASICPSKLAFTENLYK
jgi:endonuclease-3